MIRATFDSRERAYRIDGYPLERDDSEVLLTLLVTYQPPEPDVNVPEDIEDVVALVNGAEFELTAAEEHEIRCDVDIYDAIREERRTRA